VPPSPPRQQQLVKIDRAPARKLARDRTPGVVDAVLVVFARGCDIWRGGDFSPVGKRLRACGGGGFGGFPGGAAGGHILAPIGFAVGGGVYRGVYTIVYRLGFVNRVLTGALPALASISACRASARGCQ
jgi:hypothetical protein